MLARICLFVSLFVCHIAYSQHSFQKPSPSEKCWVIKHPFVSKKAQKATHAAISICDSVKRIGTIGADNNGGELDAFKHCLWMACLSKKIGSRKALQLGRAHERGNYLQFKKHKQEDAALPDSVSSAMDLFNNQIGSQIAKSRKTNNTQEIITAVLHALQSGELRIIKKDKAGNFIDCSGTKLLLEQYKQIWAIPKCLVKSNE
jgi:hypothetical protein